MAFDNARTLVYRRADEACSDAAFGRRLCRAHIRLRFEDELLIQDDRIRMGGLVRTLFQQQRYQYRSRCLEQGKRSSASCTDRNGAAIVLYLCNHPLSAQAEKLASRILTACILYAILRIMNDMQFRFAEVDAAVFYEYIIRSLNIEFRNYL